MQTVELTAHEAQIIRETIETYRRMLEAMEHDCPTSDRTKVVRNAEDTIREAILR